MSTTSQAATPHALQPERAEVTVIKSKGKKKRRRYSRRFKLLGRTEKQVSEAVQRAVDAVSSGLDEYRDRAEKSGRKKKDGALRDMIQNSIRGMGKSMVKASKIPSILAKLFR